MLVGLPFLVAPRLPLPFGLEAVSASAAAAEATSPVTPPPPSEDPPPPPPPPTVLRFSSLEVGRDFEPLEKESVGMGIEFDGG